MAAESAFGSNERFSTLWQFILNIGLLLILFFDFELNSTELYCPLWWKIYR